MRAQAFLAVVFLSAFAVAAQEATNSATIDVPVTSLDLVVTDAKGAHVTGLAKDDLEIVEGGQAREITNFAEVRSADAAARAGRRILILFDNVTLTLANRKLFAAAARDFVETSLQARDRVLVASLTTDATVRQPWTSDRAAVLAMIDTIAKEAPVGRAEVQRRRLEQEIRNTRTGDAIAASGSRGSNVSFDAMSTAVRNYSAASMQESTQIVHAVGGALRFFDRTPGRKVMLIAGEGLPVRPGADMWEYLESIRMDITSGSGSAALRRSAQAAVPLTEASQFDLAPTIRGVALAARRSGVVIYPLNPGRNEKAAGGAENQEFVNTTAEFATTAGQAGGYQLLARDSGGLAFTGMKPALAFAQIARDLDGAYSVGYRSSEAPKVGALTVRSKSGHRVRFTVAGGTLSPEEAISELVSAHHTSQPVANDLGITLSADPAVQDQKKRRVAVKVQIPVKNLKFDREGNEAVGGFNVFISPGDSKGNASEPIRQSQQLRWPADAVAYLAEKNVTFAVDVMLEAGRDQISIGVQDVKSNRTGFARIAVP